ncbi:MAG: SPOR domain-containing protein [Bacteroidales bacterium]|nr:SPOR domain-containing protein [Bacteroidales bacterium]
MKRLITVILGLSLALALHAQEQQQTTEAAEAPRSVLDNLSEYVTVHQSDALSAALEAHIDRNARRTAAGMSNQTYRIRIFFDSGQNARAASEAAAARFRSLHPGVAVSRTYNDPFFKVTVGNYTTKADATAALKSLQQEFPTAFIVRN